MSRRIYIHVGLPKTATTTLQSQFFPGLNGKDGFIYSGVFQPRGSKQENTIYQRLCAGVFKGDVDGLESAIASTPEDCKIIISEEMFTVGQEHRSWHENLRRLRAMLEGHDYRILVTLRNPVDAVFSYYVEHEALRKIKPEFSPSLVDGPILSVFKYTELDSLLTDLFSADNLFYAAFDEIISGDLSAVYRFLDLSPPAERIEFAKVNQKNRSSREVFVQDRKRTDLYSLLAGWLYKRWGPEPSAPIIKGLAFTKPLFSLIGVRRKYSIPLPTPEVVEELNRRLSKEVEFYHRFTPSNLS